MTLLTYMNTQRSSIHHPRRRLVGTAHKGPAWTNAVRILRTAIQNGVDQAPGCCRSATADDVGTTIIDQIQELDAKALHVLAVSFTILVRTSQRN